ncbi:hypothetical protein CERSUDRAFT_140689 [Gelatoporia subvermispora B]|uniref:Mak10-domain-containing protein n=1 Tax=Ceriporiopsis subvermispora (strain B) TaxID=914234 RepID=M2R5W0_CERS8|nr:hypothetical protein CERSUDRAFT_140689 [Gelatoporia subvermispora B]
MDLHDVLEFPGGDDFEDVTDVFTAAARDMRSGELVMSDGYTLLDTMSAFEIGEPRMDSGMVPEEDRRPPFAPIVPLLPQEICWLLDRSFSCEMAWHAGNTLSQSVYTLLYVHHLADISPEFVARYVRVMRDAERPIELITVVLRAGIMGLLKSCDLARRELCKNKVVDCEDWQSEKAEISLLEGINVDYIIRLQDDACYWLRNSGLEQGAIDALCDRLLLRKTILQLLRLSVPSSAEELSAFLLHARLLLGHMKSESLYTPPETSLVNSAVDPYVTRFLHNFLPVRKLVLPGSDETWQAMERWLDGWEELGSLLGCSYVLSWEIAGSLRVWTPSRATPIAFVRSLTQSAILENNVFLRRFSFQWLVRRFYLETLGQSYDVILENLEEKGLISTAQSLKTVERLIVKLMHNQLRSLWYNPPRRRRYLAKAAFEWHVLHDEMIGILSETTAGNPTETGIIPHIELAPLMWRLVCAREIILSGFQQELYSQDERPIAYWYLAHVLDVHLQCLDNVLSLEAVDPTVHQEMVFQHGFLTALQAISIALCVITFKDLTLPWRRMSLNFIKRYKWTFKSEYDDLVPVVPPPDLFQFAPQVTKILQDDEVSPSDLFMFAREILLGLVGPEGLGGLSDRWQPDRRHFILQLANLCERLEDGPRNAAEILQFDPKRFRWDSTVHPWFPDVISLGT